MKNPLKYWKLKKILSKSFPNKKIVITDNKGIIPGRNHFEHKWKGKNVIGYICGGHEPR